MKELKQYIGESLLDDEEDFIDPIENFIKTDIKIIKDSLTLQNFRKERVGSVSRRINAWEKIPMIRLKSGALFKMADFDKLPTIGEGDYRIYVKFAIDEIEMESVVILGIEYELFYHKSIRLKKIINLDYKEYQTTGKIVKYLNNVLFKDKQSIVNILKDIKETGQSAMFL
jgi:hypothetical protein